MTSGHTPSIAFWHLPPDSARTGYATEGALDLTLRPSLSGTFLQTLPELVTPLKGYSVFISAQLSTDAVSALRKVWVLIIKTVEASKHARRNKKREARPLRVKAKSSVSIQPFCFKCAGVSNVGCYKRNA